MKANTITCAVVDDDPKAIQLLELMIETEPRLKLVFTETDSMRAMKYLREHPVGLLFLDGRMPGIDGIGLARVLIPPPKIILVTGHDELAMQAYEVGIADCIPKPVDIQRFTLAVHRAVGDHWAPPPLPVALPEYMLIKPIGERINTKVYFDDIVYIEASGNNLKIKLPADEVTVRHTLKEMEEKLPADRFMQVHRSFIVPLRRVFRFAPKHTWLSVQGAEKKIPIGNDYLKAFLERIVEQSP